MDLGVWLNFLSPDGPCFDLATLPIPGSTVSLSMIEGLVESHVRGPQAVRVLEIGGFWPVGPTARGGFRPVVHPGDRPGSTAAF
jgi:hypothetical protein